MGSRAGDECRGRSGTRIGDRVVQGSSFKGENRMKRVRAMANGIASPGNSAGRMAGNGAWTGAAGRLAVLGAVSMLSASMATAQSLDKPIEARVKANEAGAESQKTRRRGRDGDRRPDRRVPAHDEEDRVPRHLQQPAARGRRLAGRGAREPPAADRRRRRGQPFGDPADAQDDRLPRQVRRHRPSRSTSRSARIASTSCAS